MVKEASELVEFYQAHLDRVSRSFAFCIERLEGPLRPQVSLAYLVCRILDSVEDADWSDASAQALQFQEFESFLVSVPSDDARERSLQVRLATWINRFPLGLPEGERLLVLETASILRDLHRLPAPARDAIVEPALSMCRGMAYFARRRQGQDLRLSSMAEVDQYCFFVAGVVGEMLTRLAHLACESEGVLGAEAGERALLDSYHFGLFLQKVNILKDQLGDEQKGRFLVPCRSSVLASARDNARRAMAYLLSVPEPSSGFRLFCSWSLFLGLASLPFIEMSWQERQAIKIPRAAAWELLNEVEKSIGDDARLNAMFEMLLAAGPAAPEGGGPTPPGPTPRGPTPLGLGQMGLGPLYQGSLSKNHLKGFGLL